MSICSGEREDVIDEAREPAGLFVDDLKRLRGRMLVVGEVVGCHLGIEANVGEGGLELVADLIDEGDAATGFAEGAVVFAVEPKGDEEEGGGDSEEVEEGGARELVGVL